MSQQKLIDTVRQQFGQSNQWALVVGDLMLDRYLIGEVQRISPEAPVPVVLLRQQSERAGGAANVAANLAGLGIKTHIAGCIGSDAEGDSDHTLHRFDAAAVDLGFAVGGGVAFMLGSELFGIDARYTIGIGNSIDDTGSEAAPKVTNNTFSVMAAYFFRL